MHSHQHLRLNCLKDHDRPVLLAEKQSCAKSDSVRVVCGSKLRSNRVDGGRDLVGRGGSFGARRGLFIVNQRFDFDGDDLQE